MMLTVFFLLPKNNQFFIKKSKEAVYSKDKVLLKIYNKLDKKLINEKDLMPNYTPFVKEKKY